MKQLDDERSNAGGDVLIGLIDRHRVAEDIILSGIEINHTTPRIVLGGPSSITVVVVVSLWPSSTTGYF